MRLVFRRLFRRLTISTIESLSNLQNTRNFADPIGPVQNPARKCLAELSRFYQGRFCSVVPRSVRCTVFHVSNGNKCGPFSGHTYAQIALPF